MHYVPMMPGYEYLLYYKGNRQGFITRKWVVNGVGKLKYFRLNLQIDNIAMLVVQPLGRLSFNVRKISIKS